MARQTVVRRVRWAALTFAPVVAVAVTTTIILLSLALLAVRVAGMSTYVVQGGPAESMVPIGSLVVVAPESIPAPGPAEAPRPGIKDTAWVAIPTLGYAVAYAEAYSPPIVMGLVVWVISMFVVRALAPYLSAARRRLPA